MALNLEAFGALIATNTYRHVRVETNLLPPITIDVAEAIEGPPSPFMQLLQPRLVLDGPAGRVELAPYGAPVLAGIAGASIGAVVAIGILIGAFLLGRASA